jgi:hypothetical protein
MNNIAKHLRMALSRASYLMLVTVSAFALSACGGGGGGGLTGGSGGAAPSGEDMDGSGPTTNTYTQFLATTSGATSTFRTVAIDNNFGTADPITGTFNHATNQISGGALAGSLNQQRTKLTLAGGGTVTLTNPAATEYVRFFKTSRPSDDNFGVVGQATFNDDIPDSASAVYNGAVEMEVNNSDTYILTGDARITANWGSGVDALFSNLSGTVSGGSNQNVSGTIGITGASLNGSSFAGGNLVRTGTIFNSTGNVDPSFEGQFYGQNADEVGGIFTMTSSADDVNVAAVFAAE